MLVRAQPQKPNNCSAKHSTSTLPTQVMSQNYNDHIITYLGFCSQLLRLLGRARDASESADSTASSTSSKHAQIREPCLAHGAGAEGYGQADLSLIMYVYLTKSTSQCRAGHVRQVT